MNPIAAVSKLPGYLVRNARYLTFRKMLNMALVNIEYLLKRERLRGYPYDITVEVTNVCNSNCILCPTGQGLVSRPKGFMSLENFKHVVDRITPFAYTLTVSQWGEPLLNKDVYDMIRYAHSKGIYTFMSTNLHAFDPKDASKLIGCGLDELMVSLHGLSQGTYEAYQPGKNFNEVIAKLRAIVRAKEAVSSKKPKIVMNFVVTKKNEGELAGVDDFAKRLGIDYSISAASFNIRFIGLDRECAPMGISDKELDAMISKRLEEWMPAKHVTADQVRSCYGMAKEGSRAFGFPKKITACDWPWRKTVINWDGGVTICCGIFENRYDFGNILSEPFADIWNNEKYRASRRTFKRPGSAAKDIPCAGCPGWKI
jgi:radical SAM protein with 4Fe4S-binding SPASM domain